MLKRYGQNKIGSFYYEPISNGSVIEINRIQTLQIIAKKLRNWYSISRK